MCGDAGAATGKMWDTSVGLIVGVGEYDKVDRISIIVCNRN